MIRILSKSRFMSWIFLSFWHWYESNLFVYTCSMYVLSFLRDTPNERLLKRKTDMFYGIVNTEQAVQSNLPPHSSRNHINLFTGAFMISWTSIWYCTRSSSFAEPTQSYFILPGKWARIAITADSSRTIEDAFDVYLSQLNTCCSRK